jgi:hypothetical protein
MVLSLRFSVLKIREIPENNTGERLEIDAGQGGRIPPGLSDRKMRKRQDSELSIDYSLANNTINTTVADLCRLMSFFSVICPPSPHPRGDLGFLQMQRENLVISFRLISQKLFG